MRALIVDDESDSREGLRDFIPWAELGVGNVYLATNGIEAYQMSQQVKPDIIISDIRMPKMDGIAFIEKVRKLLPSSKFILMSAYSDKSYLMSAIEFQVSNYVEKPINITEMTVAIKTAVDMINNERSMLSIVQGNTDLLQKIALRLTEPQFSMQEMIKDIDRTKPDFLTQKCYCTVLVKTSLAKNQTNKRINADMEMDALKESFSATFASCLLARGDNNCFIVHVCDKMIANELNLQKLLQKATSAINICLNLQNGVFIAAGKTVMAIEHISKSYKEAVECSECFFFTGYGTIVIYNQANKCNATLPGISFLDDFEKHLRSNDKANAMETLGQFWLHVRQNKNVDVDGVRNLLNSLAVLLTSVCLERNLPDNKAENHDFTWKMIAEKETFSEIYDYLVKRTENFFTALEYTTIRKPVFRIIMYIERNYSKKTLTLHDIAENVHLTSTHICNLFKKEMGRTINQYLNDFRIEKAKMLLKDHQSKLVEVAAQVGYNDANYFMRTFKKITGITPSEYREKYLLQ